MRLINTIAIIGAGALDAIMESAMRKVLAIAKASHVNLVEENLTNWYSLLSALSPEGKTSMLQDIEAGRKTEVDMFAGKVVESGTKYAIPTPINTTFLRMLNVIENV